MSVCPKDDNKSRTTRPYLTAACFLINPVADPTTCNSCLADAGNGDDIAMCNSMQVPFACSNMTFPNVGSTHCYTAAGWYSQNDMWMTGVVRGCMNCTGQLKYAHPTLVGGECSRHCIQSEYVEIEYCGFEELFVPDKNAMKLTVETARGPVSHKIRK